MILGMEISRVGHEVFLPGRRNPSPLALLRFVRGLSQRELAEMAGVTRRTIINLEHARNAPRLSTATAIASSLGLDDPRLVFPDAFKRPFNEEGRPGQGTASETSGAGVAGHGPD